MGLAQQYLGNMIFGGSPSDSNTPQQPALANYQDNPTIPQGENAGGFMSPTSGITPPNADMQSLMNTPTGLMTWLHGLMTGGQANKPQQAPNPDFTNQPNYNPASANTQDNFTPPKNSNAGIVGKIAGIL